MKIPYTDDELRQMAEHADRLGIRQVYAATHGIATDYGIQVDETDRMLNISYPHFLIQESANDVRPHGKADQTLHLPNGTAEWFAHDGTGEWYMKLGGTYVSVRTAKPFDADQLLAVAASLKPLESIGQPVPKPQVTHGYLFALHAADEFLNAWLHRDAKSGMDGVSADLKKSTAPADLIGFFTSLSNPHHQAYEITGKKRLNERTYRFDVILYEYYTAQPDPINGLPSERPPAATLDVILDGYDRYGDEVWKVNHLP